MNLRKIRQDLLRLFGHFFLYYIISALCKSLKINRINDEAIKNLKSRNQNFVLAFWHGTMLLPWYLHGSPDFAGLTSQSKDGDLLAKILRKWKYKVIRGSSNVGGDEALDTMIDLSKNKYSIAITPDGPRGPQHKFKAGAVITAKKTNIPVVLAGVGFKRKKILKNWDQFEIPYFFSKAKIVYSYPIYVNSNITYEETSSVILICEEKLNELQRQANEFS
jgi:lysophospholipid acyltransferase (LPLAT)-like uncharacterized protein